jgi:Cdc6-like AAA superfamily ATPase
MVSYGAARGPLEDCFMDQLADDGDMPGSVRDKIDRLLHPDSCVYCEYIDQMASNLPPDSGLSVLTPEQRAVAFQIILVVSDHSPQLTFLQGAGGTGKTLTIKTLVAALESSGQGCLICGTTGIAAVQYR